jgi:hypothetical protein
MSLNTLPTSAQALLSNPKGLLADLVEVQGRTMTVVTGATANTKINVAAMRKGDTLHNAIVFTDAGGAVADDAANMTIQDTHATGTLTISGNPVADETVTVNGNVYTWKAAANVKALNHVAITAGDNTAMAAALAAAINAYEARYQSQLHGDGWRTPAVSATSALGVVTVTALADGVAGNSITITEASTNVAASGATLAGGTATGGVKSTTDLSAKHVLLVWSNKDNA